MRRVTMVKGQRVIVLKERADFWTQGQLFVKRDKTKTLQRLFIYSLCLHFCVLPTLDFIALWCHWNLWCCLLRLVISVNVTRGVKGGGVKKWYASVTAAEVVITSNRLSVLMVKLPWRNEEMRLWCFDCVCATQVKSKEQQLAANSQKKNKWKWLQIVETTWR